MSDHQDIVITWPKAKPLEHYLAELIVAWKEDKVINYRVARVPKWEGAVEDHGWTGWSYGGLRPRCFVVHSGIVRGWCEVLGTCHREEGEVEGWPAGLYIVRSPLWHEVGTQCEMRGFQGWRWVPRELADKWLGRA